MTTIYVDADACPVKDEVTAIAIRHGCRAVMVCNGGIRPNPHPLIDLVIVDDGPDPAIADHHRAAAMANGDGGDLVLHWTGVGINVNGRHERTMGQSADAQGKVMWPAGGSFT